MNLQRENDHGITQRYFLSGNIYHNLNDRTCFDRHNYFAVHMDRTSHGSISTVINNLVIRASTNPEPRL
jgi:hypothetical protein